MKVGASDIALSKSISDSISLKFTTVGLNKIVLVNSKQVDTYKSDEPSIDSMKSELGFVESRTMLLKSENIECLVGDEVSRDLN